MQRFYRMYKWYSGTQYINLDKIKAIECWGDSINIAFEGGGMAPYSFKTEEDAKQTFNEIMSYFEIMNEEKI